MAPEYKWKQVRSKNKITTTKTVLTVFEVKTQNGQVFFMSGSLHHFGCNVMSVHYQAQPNI